MKKSSWVNKILSSEPDPAFARRAKIIFENLDISGKEKILDIGCGRGFYLKVLYSCFPKLKLYGLDLNQEYLNYAKRILAKKSVQLIKAEATNLPFGNNFFDRVIASEILEHLKDDQGAIKEIYRVLKPEGIALITVPNRNYPFFWDPINWLLEKFFNFHFPSNIWWLAGIWADHQRLYDEKKLREKLKKAGFKVEKTWLATQFCFPFSHFLFYGLGKNLIERGFFSDFNRFLYQPKQSLLNKILLWPIRKIDQLNEKNSQNKLSVNIIFKAKKS